MEPGELNDIAEAEHQQTPRDSQRAVETRMLQKCKLIWPIYFMKKGRCKDT